jgi:feruloyl esterase
VGAKGVAPAQIVASRITDGKTERTRPPLPHPQVATYRGQGDTNDAASFVCR